jgi:hypothetical protein
VGFAVPFAFTDLLTLPRDLNYAIYAAVAIGFFVLWSRSTQQSLAAMMRRRWVLAVVLGLAVAVIMGPIVLRTEPASSGSTGASLVWDVLWRGVIYGAADGLFLSSNVGLNPLGKNPARSPRIAVPGAERLAPG